MYRTLRENMSISDLVNRASTLSSDDASVKRLMNLIMQFRKVCNHPELFERADVSAPLAWVDYNFTGNLVRDPEVLEVRYATRSTIEYVVPKVVYRDAVDVPGAPTHKGSDSLYLDRLLNIWTPDHIHHSIQEGTSLPPRSSADRLADSVFSFAPLLELSPADLSRESRAGGFQSVGRALARQNAAISRANVASCVSFPMHRRTDTGPESSPPSRRSSSTPSSPPARVDSLPCTRSTARLGTTRVSRASMRGSTSTKSSPRRSRPSAPTAPL